MIAGLNKIFYVTINELELNSLHQLSHEKQQILE